MVERGEHIELVLDQRLGADVPRRYAQSVAWLVANALAIGKGYSYLGAESKDMPFAPKLMDKGKLDE